MYFVNYFHYLFSFSKSITRDACVWWFHDGGEEGRDMLMS